MYCSFVSQVEIKKKNKICTLQWHTHFAIGCTRSISTVTLCGTERTKQNSETPPRVEIYKLIQLFI